jgi:hypothetical protein
MSSVSITAPITPAISMGLKLNVTNGRNQIQRNVGNYAALYLVPGSRIVENYLELAVGETFNSNAGESTNNLVLSTSGQLTFSGTLVSGAMLEFNINKVLVLDDSLSEYSFTNNTNAVVRVNLNAVNFNDLAPTPAVFYGVATQPTEFNAAFITSLTGANVNKNQTINVNAGTGEFIYYCYPVVLGQSNFTSNGFTGGMGIVAVATLDTSTGTQQYYVYQSTNPGLGPTTLIITSA